MPAFTLETGDRPTLVQFPGPRLNQFALAHD
jgi:hypothetical protein